MAKPKRRSAKASAKARSKSAAKSAVKKAPAGKKTPAAAQRAKPTLVVGNKNYSSWSLRPWLALKQTKQKFEEIVVPLRHPYTRGEILKHSPSGKVPLLTHGSVRVWESLAICEYLAEAFPAAKLWPQDPAVRAHARAVSNEMHAGFAELRRTMPMDIRNRWPKPPASDAALDDVDRVATIWRDCRKTYGAAGAHGRGPFLYGGFCIADAMYAPVCTRFVTYGVKLDPVAQAYVDAVVGHPSMIEWADAAAKEPWEIVYPAFNKP